MGVRPELSHTLSATQYSFKKTRLVGALACLTPSLLGRMFWRAAGERDVALNLHRVHDRERRAGELQPSLSIDERALDALLHVLVDTRRARSGRVLATFDDGYGDACAYVESRAPRFREVEWLFFVCPEKTLLRRGFRWDAYELMGTTPSARALQELLLAPVDPDDDAAARELDGLGDHPSFTLATVDECRRVATLPNVRLGNHSDHHLCASSLSVEALRREVRRSTERFTELFGAPAADYAFPFGTPGVHWHEREARVVAEEASAVLWSTESRTFLARDRRRGSVVPRVPVIGDWSLAENLALLVRAAVRSLTVPPRVPSSSFTRAPARPASAWPSEAPTPAAGPVARELERHP